jgi:hypothetical protein
MSDNTSTFQGQQVPTPITPPGTRPGDIPTIAWPQQVWLIRSAHTTPQQRQIESMIEKHAAAENLSLGSFRALTVRTKGVGAVTVLRPSDVRQLYRSIHRSLALVLSTAGVRIQRSLTEAPSSKGSDPIDRFLRYKAFHRLATKPSEVDATFKQFRHWCAREFDLRRAADPRMLPSLSFGYRCDSDLDTPAGYEQFLRSHGSPWTDSMHATWDKAQQPHTLDSLHIGGATIPVGLHWDVQIGKPLVLHNGWEDWELPGQGYANVHPDGHLRGSNGTRRKPQAWGDPEGPAVPRKTPRERRRSRR